MPHPKNRLKLTGDTHLPDRMDFLADEEPEQLDAEDSIATPPPVYADGYVPPAMNDAMPPPQPAGPLAVAERRIQALPARSPWLAVGAGVLFGWLVAKMLRR
jgi:hypothetical protein